MSGISISGLASSLDTQGIIDQLMRIEANPQTLLKRQLSATQTQATSYRAVNTRFDAVRTAAEALTRTATWSAVTASSTSPSVTAATSAGATAGSVTFTVNNVARAHSVVSDQNWTVTSEQTAADVLYGASTLDVTVGGTTTTLSLDVDGDGSATLAEAAKAINSRSDLGLNATAVRVSPTEYRLQVTAARTGGASVFSVGAAGTFDVVTQGTDAMITVGSGTGYTMTSATNTFAGLMDGTAVTVSQPATDVTVSVVSDPEAVANKVNALVTAVNGLLDAISSYTDPGSSSASLKGDRALRQLASQTLDIVSRAVGGSSASTVGLELTKDGRYTFDRTAFVAALTADPAQAQRMFTATATGPGADGDLTTTADNVTSPVGIAAQLAALAKTASDTTTGTLTRLAKSSDSRVEDLKDRIDAWDLRLELRRSTLMRQFTAMETALSSLKSQSAWLTAALGSLPGATKPSS